jgi:chemotaxis response regulator CheB
MPTIRVLVADESDAMRREINTVLRSTPHLVLVGETSNCIELLLAFDAYKPDVVLMDVNLPKSPAEAQAVKSFVRDSCLLAMSVRTDVQTSEIAKSYGAVRLLDKADLATTLEPAIEECVRK